MGKLFYSCEQAARLSSKAMEQPLAPTERILLGVHLTMCKGCTRFAQQIEFLRRASRKIPEVLEKDAN
jgi:hypothetical protein